MGQHAEKSGTTRTYHRKGSRGKASSRWAIFVIFQKQIAILIEVYTFLESFKRTKLLRFESQLKN